MSDEERAIAEAAQLMGISPDAVRRAITVFQRSTAVPATTADMMARINRRLRGLAEFKPEQLRAVETVAQAPSS